MVPNALPDDDLLQAFEGRSLETFHHLEHIRLAFSFLRRAKDLAAGAAAFRVALRAFADARGAHGLYHETLTWAYLALVNARMAEADDADSLAFVARCPELLDHRRGALAAHYDVAAITASTFARETFVLPRRSV